MSNKIIELVVQHTLYKPHDIMECHLLFNGYTNTTYMLVLNDTSKLFVKLAHANTINLIDEGEVINVYNPNLLEYSDAHGLLITKWIDSATQVFDNSSNQQILLLAQEIEYFHSLVIKQKLKKFNYLKYETHLKKSIHTNNYYHQMIDKWNTTKRVISHNDINRKNFLLTILNRQAKIVLIDFEWTTFNYAWWDYINYLTEEEIYDELVLKKWIKHIPNVTNITDIYELMFIRWWYCYGWAIQQKYTLPHMEEYIVKCIKNIKWLMDVLACVIHDDWDSL